MDSGIGKGESWVTKRMKPGRVMEPDGFLGVMDRYFLRRGITEEQCALFRFRFLRRIRHWGRIGKFWVIESLRVGGEIM